MATYRIEIIIDPTRAQRGAQQVERSLDRVRDRGDRVRRLLARTFALVGVGAAVHQVAQFSDSFIDLQNRVRIASDSLGGELTPTMNEVTAVAVRTRAPVLALAGVFQRGSIAAKELNATQEELIRLAEIAGKAVAIQGGGLQTARGALTQLSQTLGQSIVRGEEFNSILEGAFPIALAAARGIERVEGSVGRLRTEIIEGRVTSEEFFRGILAGGEEIDRQFSLTTPTIGQAFTVLRTGLVRSAEALNDVSAPLAGFIRDVGLAVTVMAGVERQQIVTPEQEGRVMSITAAVEALRITTLATAVVLAGRFAQSQATAAAASFTARGAHVGALRAIVARREALRDLRVFQLADIRATSRGIVATDLIASAHGRAAVATNLHTAAQRRLVAATSASAIAMAGLRGGLAILGGPVGIALLAAYAIYEFTSSVERASEELGRGLGPLEAYRKSLEGLTTAQFAVQRLDIEIDIDEALGEIDRLQVGLDNVQSIIDRGFTQELRSRTLVQVPLSPENIQRLTDEWVRGTAQVDIYNQRIRDLQARLDVLAFVGPPELPEPAPPEAAEAPDEKARERSLDRLAKLAESADDRIAASALSRIDQITREEEIGVARAIELGLTRGVSAERVEAAITSIRLAGALERQQIVIDADERDRQVEERRVERIERLNDKAVRSITQSLVSLQSEYDQAVISAIQKAEQTAAALDRESAAYEANLETVRRVLEEETRLAGVARTGTHCIDRTTSATGNRPRTFTCLANGTPGPGRCWVGFT